MKIKNLIAVFVVLFATMTVNAQTKKYIIHTVAFYNFENLFDTINGPNNDEEWLVNGAMNWTGKKYQKKLNLRTILSLFASLRRPLLSQLRLMHRVSPPPLAGGSAGGPGSAIFMALLPS